jgi:hypothetical protein
MKAAIRLLKEVRSSPKEVNNETASDCLVFARVFAAAPRSKNSIRPGATLCKAWRRLPLKVHISGVRISQDCAYGTCYDGLAADAVLNQRKIELSGGFICVPKFFQVNLAPDDYSARLLKIAHKGAASPFFDEYELLLPDRHVWQCYVTGIFE